MPCYCVTDKEAADGKPAKRLVEANNRASARNHVARDRFDVKQASPHDIAEVIKGGGEIEVATGSNDDVELEPEPTKEPEEPPSDTPPNDDPPQKRGKPGDKPPTTI